MKKVKKMLVIENEDRTGLSSIEVQDEFILATILSTFVKAGLWHKVIEVKDRNVGWIVEDYS